MQIYRVVKAEYADTAFRGSRARGGIALAPRWYTRLIKRLPRSWRHSHTSVAALSSSKGLVLFSVELDEEERLVRLPSSELPANGMRGRGQSPPRDRIELALDGNQDLGRRAEGKPFGP